MLRKNYLERARLIYRTFACFFILFVFQAPVFAGDKNAISSGEWSDPAIWSPNGVPTASDSVTISADTFGDAIQVSVTNGNAVSAGLYIGLDSIGNSSILLVESGNTLAINGSISINGDLQFGSGGGTIELTGDWLLYGSFESGIGSTIVFKGSADQLISVGSTQFNNCTIQNTGGSVILDGVQCSISGDLQILSGTLDVSDQGIDHLTPASGTMKIDSAATLKIGGSIRFPRNFSTYNLHASSNTVYYGQDQTIFASTVSTFGNVLLTGTGKKTFSGTLSIVGDLTVNATVSSLAGTSGNIYRIGGNITSNSLFKPNNSQMILNGSGTQTVLLDTVANLTIQKQAGSIASLSQNLKVGKFLTVNIGILDISQYTVDVITPVSGSTLTVGAAGTLKIGSTNSFPSGYSSISLASGSIVEYNGSNQTVYGPLTYSHLLLSGSGTKTAGSDIRTNGNLTLTNVTFNQNSTSDTLGGNLSLTNSTFSGNGTTIFTNTTVFTNNGGTLTFNDVYLSAGASVSDNGTSFTVTGNWNNAGFLTFTGTVTFNSNAAQAITGSDFFSVVFSGAGAKNINGVLNIGGNWSNSGTVNTNNIINFNGTGAQTVDNGNSAFPGIQIDKASGTFTALNDLSITGNMVIIAGTFDDGGKQITLTGDLANDGVYQASGSMIFNGTTSITGGGTFTFNSVTINNAKTIVDNGNTLNVKGNWTNNGTYTATGEINFNGTNAQSISSSHFNSIDFSNNGTKTIGGVLTIAGNVVLNNNTTVIAGSFTHVVEGNWTKAASATFTATGSTIKFNGALSETISGANFNTVEFSGAGPKTISGNLTIAGDFLITAAATTVDATSSTVTIAGDWTNDGVFTPSTGTVTFSKNGAIGFNGLNTATNFHNLTISHANGVLTVPANSKIVLDGTFTETGYLSGTIENTQDVSFQNTNYTFGGIGATLNFPANTPGLTTIQRTTGVVSAGFDVNQVVKRVYSIVSAGIDSLPVNIQMKYDDVRELNSQVEAELGIWKSDVTDATVWERIGSSQPNAAANRVSASTFLIQGSQLTFSSNKVRRFTAANGNWNVTTNWNPVGIPTSADSAEIPAGKTCLIPLNYQANSGSLNIEGTLSSGNSSTLNVAGLFLLVSGTYNANSGTVNFNGADQYIDVVEFNNASFSGSGIKTLNGAITFNGDVNISTGVTVNGGTYNYIAKGNWTNSGTYSASGASKVTFNRNDNQQQTISGGQFQNLVLTGTGTKLATGSLAIAGNIQIDQNVTFTAGANSDSIGGNWTNSGTFTATGSTIVFNGGAQSISGGNFENITIAGTNTKTVSGLLTVTGDVKIENNSTFDAANFNHTFDGNWITNGSFTSTGNIHFTGTNKSISGGTSTPFTTLTIDGTISSSSSIQVSNTLTINGIFSIGGDIQITSAMVVNGSCTQTSGTSNFNGTPTTLTGTADLKDILIPNGKELRLNANALLGIAGSVQTLGTGILNVTTNNPTAVEFNGAIDQSIPSQTYRDVIVTNGHTKTASGNVTINGILTVDTQTTLSDGGSIITIKGDVENDGIFTGTGTVVVQVNSGFNGAGSYDFNNLTVSGNNSLNTGSLTIVVRGAYLNSNGTLTSSGKFMFSGGNQDITGTSFNKVYMAGTGTKTLKTSTVFFDSVEIGANVTLDGSTLNHTVKGNWNNNGIYTSSGTSKVTFDNNGDQYISASQFNNLVLGGGGTKFATGSITVNGTTQISVDFNAGSFTHYISGDWTNTGDFHTSGSTIELNGNAAQLITASKFENVIMSGNGTKTLSTAVTLSGSLEIQAGATFTANNSLTVNNDLTIDNTGVFNGGNSTHTIAGNWRNNGTFNANTSTLLFKKNGTATFSGATTVNNLSIDAATTLQIIGGNTVVLSGSLTESGYLVGAISKQLNLTNANNPYNFGDIGATISFAGAQPGVTTVVRTTGSVASGFGASEAITRYYSVTSANAPAGGASLTLGYNFTREQNGQTEPLMTIWKGNLAGTTWVNQTQSIIDTTNKNIQLQNVTSFSLWGISSNSTETFTSANGSWNESQNWSPKAIPTSIDSVYIPAGRTANVDGNFPTTAKGIFIDGTLTAVDASTIDIKGAWNRGGGGIFTPSSGLVQFSGANQNISATTFGNVTFSGSGTKMFSGAISVNGNATISNGVTIDAGAGNVTHTFSGDVQNDGIFVPNSTSVTFNKNGTASFSGNTDFYNIIISASTILQVRTGDTVTVENSLTENGYLNGIARATNILNDSHSFYYFGNLGITINFTGTKPDVTTVIRTSGFVPQGFDSTQAVRRYFAITSKNNPSSANLSLAYSSSELQGVDETQLKLWRSEDNGGSWSIEPTATVDTQSNTVAIANISEFSTWAISSSQVRIFGKANGNWDVASNWVPTGIPDATDSTFIASGRTSIIPAAYNAISRSIHIGGTLQMTNGTVTVSNNWTKDLNATFTSGTGTAIFSGADQNISATNFANVNFTNTGNKTLLGNIAVSGSLSIDQNVSLTASTNSVSVQGDWLNNGTFVSTGTVNFTGSNVQSISFGTMNDVIFSGTGTKNLFGKIAFHNVTITQNSMVDGLSSTDSVSGDWTNNGQFNSNGTVVFNSIVPQTISQSDFYNVVFLGNGIKTAVGSLTMGGNVTINAGTTFRAGNYNHSVSGNWTKSTTGTFDATGSTIIFNGGSTQTITESNFSNITFQNAGKKEAFGPLTITGNVDIQSGFTGGNYQHSVGGDWNESGTFNSGEGTITFTKAGTAQFTGNSTFNVLEVNNGTVLAIGNGSSITLKDSLIETGYVTGSVLKEENIADPSSPYMFGGIGASIQIPSVNDALGNVTVKRVTGTVPTNFAANQAVKRWFTIFASQPSSTASVKFTFDRSREINGQHDANLKLWESTNDGVSWGRKIVSDNDSVNNTLSILGFDSVSSWAITSLLGRVPSAGQGFWNDPALWSPGGIPTQSDSIYIPPSSSISIPAGFNVSISSLNNMGTLNVGANDTVHVFANWHNSGSFNADSGSTISFESGNQYIDSSRFYNLTLTGTGVKTATNSFTVQHYFDVDGIDFNDGGHTIHIQGDMHLASSYSGSGTTVFDGNSILSGTGSLVFNNVVISGTLVDSIDTVNVKGNWTMAQNASFHSVGIIVLSGTDTQHVSASNFNDITINKPSGAVVQSGAIIVGNNFTLANGNFDTKGKSFSTSGNFNLNNGTFTANNSTITVSKNWLRNGNFIPGTSTVVFDRVGAQIIRSSTFYNLSIAGSGDKSSTGDLVIKGNLNIGTAAFNDGGFSVSLFGNLNVDSLYSGTGSIAFDSNSTLSGAGIFNFNDVSVNQILHDNGKSINVHGNWVKAGSGTFNASGTVNLNGSVPQSIGTSTFNNITFANTGAKTLTGSLHISGNVFLDSLSIVNAATFTDTVNGNWTKHQFATFNENTSTVNFAGTDTQSIGASNFYNLVFSNSGVKKAGGNLLVKGSLANFNSEFLAGTFTHTLDNNFVNNGMLNPGASTFMFTHDAALSGNATTFNNLQINTGVTLSVLSPSKVFLLNTFTENGYLVGKIIKSEQVTQPATRYVFGNIGAEMNFAITSPGTTTVERITGVFPTGFDTSAVIKRAYNVITQFPSADDTLKLYYSRRELNSQQENQLKFWKSPDSGKRWSKIAETQHSLDTSLFMIGVDTVQYVAMSSIGTRLFPQGVVRFWNEDSIWSPKGIPTKNDDVIIPNNATCKIPINYKGAVCRNLTVDPSGNLEIVGSDTLKVYGNWKSNGRFQTSSGTIELESGNYSIDSTAFYNLVLQGTGTKTASSQISINNAFEIKSGTFDDGGNKVQFFGTPGKLIVDGTYSGTTGSLVVNDSTITSGTGRFNLGTVRITPSGKLNNRADTLYVYKDWLNTGMFTSNGNITMAGSAGQTIQLSNLQQQAFHNLIIAGIGTSASTDILVDNDLTISSGSTFTSGTHTVTVGGDWINNSDVPDSGGTVSLTGTGKKIRGGASTITFNSLDISGNVTTQKNLKIRSTLKIERTGVFLQTAGTTQFAGTSIFPSQFIGKANLMNVDIPQARELDLADSAIIGIAGTLSLDQATFNIPTSTPTTVEFNGNTNQTIPGISYYNLTLSNQHIKSARANITINGDLTLSDTLTTFSLGGKTLTLSGNIVNKGGIYDGFGTTNYPTLGKKVNLFGTGQYLFRDLNVEFGDTLSSIGVTPHIRGNFSNNGILISDKEIVFDGGDQNISASTFNNLHIAGQGIKTVTGNLLINNNMLVDSAGLNLGSFEHKIKGNIINNGALEAGTGKIVFIGDSIQTITSPSPLRFNKLFIDKLSSVSINNDITVSDTLKVTRGTVVTNSKQVNLDSTSILIETPGNTILGTVTANRMVQQQAKNSFNGIGIELLARWNAPGQTVVIRKTGTALPGTGGLPFPNHHTILRYFDIQPSVFDSLNASVYLHYNNADTINQNSTSFRVWTTLNNGAVWHAFKRATGSNINDNIVVADSIKNFSSITRVSAADDDNALQGNIINIYSYQIADTNLRLSTPYVRKPWYLSLRKDTPFGTVVKDTIGDSLNVMNLLDGTYYVLQGDSSAHWNFVGYHQTGFEIEKLDSVSNDTVRVDIGGGENSRVTYYNFHRNSITVKATMDNDSDLTTLSERVQIPWKYYLKFGNTYFDSITTLEWNFDKLTDNIYTLKERDSSAWGWSVLAVVITRSDTLPDTLFHTDSVSFRVKDGASYTIEFINSPPQESYLTLTQSEWMTIPNKLSRQKPANPLSQKKPTIGNVADTVFAKAFAYKKTGLSIGVVPGTTKEKEKAKLNKLGYYNIRDKGQYLRQFLGHTGPAKGLEKQIGEGRNPKMTAGMDNKLVGEFLAFKMNLAMSDAFVSPARLGNVIYNSGNSSNYLEGKTLREISHTVDTVLTYWRSHAAGGVSDTTFYNSIYQTLQQIDTAFHSTIVPGDFVLNPADSVYSPLKLSNKGVQLFRVPFLKKNLNPTDTLNTLVYNLPSTFKLYQNYPNPFNGQTIIQYDLPYDAKVSIEVYNILGQNVATVMHNEYRTAGPDEVVFKVGDLPSGVYFYRMTASTKDTDPANFTGEFIESRKLILIK